MNNSNGIASAKSNGPLSEPAEPRRPVSGTMARVALADAPTGEPAAAETPPASGTLAPPSSRPDSVVVPKESTIVPAAKSSETQLSAGERDDAIANDAIANDADVEDDDERFTEDVTTVSTSRPFFDDKLISLRQDDDEECTREYHDLPTRVMHVDDSGERVIERAPPSSGMRSVPAVLATPQKTLVLNAPPTASPTVEVQASALIEQPRAADPLAVDRALLRVIASPPPMTVPIVAVRPAPPTPRLLAVVAGFTALGMLWVLAVAAMVLSFIVR